MAGDNQSKLSTGAAAECSQWGTTNQSQTMIFPTKLSAINHQGGSLVHSLPPTLTRQHQAGTLCNSVPQPGHIHILYKAHKTHPQSLLSRVQRSWMNTMQRGESLLFDKEEQKTVVWLYVNVCSIGMQPPSLGGYLAQVGITRGQN